MLDPVCSIQDRTSIIFLALCRGHIFIYLSKGDQNLLLPDGITLITLRERQAHVVGAFNECVFSGDLLGADGVQAIDLSLVWERFFCILKRVFVCALDGRYLCSLIHMSVFGRCWACRYPNLVIGLGI